MKPGPAALLLIVAGLAQAAEPFKAKPGRYESPADVAAVLKSVPFLDQTMGYADLGERLDRMGLRALMVQVESLTSADEKDNPGQWRQGDTLLSVSIQVPSGPVLALCAIQSRFQLVRRGPRWLPQDRTANFLLNGHGHCRAPA